LEEKAFAYADALKIGRTHLQDAVPMTLGQEISGWAAQLRACIESIDAAARHLRAIPIGGTAVGTGLNAPPGFAAAMVKELSAITGLPLTEAPNKFAGLAAHDALAFASGALRTLAGALMKIANDIRWLASGPECGLGELELPANEPGSSIMPGKVNPTQAEAVTQVAVQVYGNDAAVAFAASQGNLELNVYKPVIIRNVVESAELLADACQRFREYCVAGLKARPERLAHYVQRSDALITALVPHLGYDKCAEIVRRAHASGTSLREAATALSYASEEEFERWIDPNHMARPGRG
jgi:fumarate hydratase class II